ncbi:MAG: prolyl oligopeptidase family serine peptidase [Cyclobacteriaceae bacterium]
MFLLFKYYIALFTLLLSFTLSAQQEIYYCPPCPFDCHNEPYNQPGLCPVCNMDLLKRIEVKFKNYHKQPVLIKNDSITLNAAYYSPISNQGQLPAVVVVHGSAPTTYDDVAFYTSIATQLGMSVLAFDKRGVGGSNGQYQPFTVEESITWFKLLASDVIACLNWLRLQPEIDKTKIGLLGGSQAGWIMPLVASKYKDVKFIISGEGVSVSAGEENYFSELTGDGADGGLSISLADKKLQTFIGSKGFDPRLILKTINTKILWFFGTADPVIPVDASLRELKEINNDNFDIIILPDGDHNFNNTKTKERYDLVNYIKPWLTKIGIL